MSSDPTTNILKTQGQLSLLKQKGSIDSATAVAIIALIIGLLALGVAIWAIIMYYMPSEIHRAQTITGATGATGTHSIISPNVVNLASPSDAVYKGCYQDTLGDRTMMTLPIIGSDYITTTECATKAREGHYKYVAFQDVDSLGNVQCFVSNTDTYTRLGTSTNCGVLDTQKGIIPVGKYLTNAVYEFH